MSGKVEDSRSVHEMNNVEKPVDLDYVLINELGEFGKFQMLNIFLMLFPVMMSAFSSEYIFSVSALPHRCTIPECDGENPEIQPPWLNISIPSDNQNCARFVSSGSSGSNGSCTSDLFDHDRVVPCDAYVHERTNSAVYDFNLECKEWIRILAGTINSCGFFASMPLTGYISDRWGRRFALVFNILNFSIFGIIRAFSVNYPMLLIFHFLQSCFGAGIYTTVAIFSTELVGPKYRVLTIATISSFFALGQVLLGGVAYLVRPWRTFILVLFVPCLFFVSYYWILSESVRWLLSNQKYDEARKILEMVARVNKKQISEKSLNCLLSPQQSNRDKVPEANDSILFMKILKSPVLLRRVCTTPMWWLSSVLTYYGISINSVTLSGNMYLNFINVSVIEIPGFFTAALLLDRIGRKATMSSAFFLSSVSCIAFAFLPENYPTLALVLFLFGKFGIAAVATSVYLYTMELYPTQYRQSLLAFSSMIGRIGSITAPLTPALTQYWEGIPSLMFGVLGLISGFLVLTQPETLGTKMPDTLEEAEQLTKKV